MARKTEGVNELVKDVLATFSKPYGEDIIEDVCLAIESNPVWLKRYHGLGDELRVWVVNNWIGKYTKDYTGLNSKTQVDAKRSKLITTYTKLNP